MDILELNVWKGDWGLPSVDVECLQVLAYAKFNGIPLKVNTSANLFETPNGKLPVLKCDAGTFDTAISIIEYFKLMNYNTQYGLEGKQYSKFLAYDAMLKEKLFPALQFIWWIDEKNVNELVRPWYYKALPFPLKLYYPVKFERQVHAMFDILYPVKDDIIDMTVIEDKVYSEAQKCLTVLSTSLGELDYFLGKEPTVLDAIVYSYLAPLLKTPLPNPALQNHLKACTNLVKYISRISDTFFQNECRKYTTKENVQDTVKYSENEFPNKRRDQIIAGVFAALVMSIYTFSTGILEASVKDHAILNIAAEDTSSDDE